MSLGKWCVQLLTVACVACGTASATGVDDPDDPGSPPVAWSAVTPFTTGDARLLGHEGVLHAVGAFGGIAGLSYRRSTDQGATWSNPVAVAGSVFPTQYHALAAEGSNLYLLTRETGGQLFFRRSPDGGSTWQPRVQVTTQAGEAPERVAITAEAGVIHVAVGASGGVFYWRSSNQGLNWTRTLMASGNGAHVPSIAANGSVVHVVWSTNTPTDHESYYRRSLDGGVTWSGPTRVSPAGGPSLRPRIVAMGSRLIVAWQNETAFQSPSSTIEVWVQRSLDGGATWEAPQQLTSAGRAYSHVTLARGSGADVHLAWVDHPGSNRPYYIRSRDFGATWGPVEQIADVDGHPFNLAVTSEYVHVILTPAGGGGGFSYARRRLN